MTIIARYEELGKPTYFCDPYSSWQKGSIENRFGLLRQFIPKKETLDNHTHKDIASYANILNNRPMKCLNWNTPKEVFEELISVKRAKIKHTN
ncbi:IS30 family transposase [Patescibacteria group bacterium]|nr:IS30 family transposase [Patescibacteria group bacterium]